MLFFSGYMELLQNDSRSLLDNNLNNWTFLYSLSFFRALGLCPFQTALSIQLIDIQFQRRLVHLAYVSALILFLRLGIYPASLPHDYYIVPRFCSQIGQNGMTILLKAESNVMEDRILSFAILTMSPETEPR